MDTYQPPTPASSSGRDEAWTVGRLLTWTTDYLKRRGSESPRLDAEVMLAHVLDWQRVELYTHFTDEVYTPEGITWIEDNTMVTVLTRHFPELDPYVGALTNAFAIWERPST